MTMCSVVANQIKKSFYRKLNLPLTKTSKSTNKSTNNNKNINEYTQYVKKLPNQQINRRREDIHFLLSVCLIVMAHIYTLHRLPLHTKCFFSACYRFNAKDMCLRQCNSDEILQNQIEIFNFKCWITEKLWASCLFNCSW